MKKRIAALLALLLVFALIGCGREEKELEPWTMPAVDTKPTPVPTSAPSFGVSDPERIVWNEAAYLNMDQPGAAPDSVLQTLTHRQTLSTLPEGFSGYSKASAIRLSPDGKFLCVSNRGYDSFACYEVGKDGGLELRGITLSNGVSPRDVNFLPGSGEFVCCNETSNTVTFFRYEDGDFTPEERKFELPGVLCCLPAAD